MVELEESLVGGRGKSGRASRLTTLVAVLVEQTPQAGLDSAHLRVMKGARTLTKAAGATILPGGSVTTDGPIDCVTLPAAGHRDEPLRASPPQAAGELLPWARIVISIFRRW